MPLPTPFHIRTAAANHTNDWRDWSGYIAAGSYDHAVEREYYAVRNSAGLLDISPLFKYDIIGPDAARLMNRVMTRNFTKCRIGQVFYSPWCDENGDMIHDGNTIRIGPNHFRLTAADPTLVWLEDCAYGLDVTIEDVTTKFAALALQGPKSRLILMQVLRGMDIKALRYFRMGQGRIGRTEVMVTRTGFTGDLGYELWFAAEHAEQIWDTLITAGTPYSLLPMGLHALDMLRVEAGLLLIEVDYISARYAVIDAQKSNPLEAGLAWAVKFNRDEKFVGYDALRKDKERGPEWQLVGLVVDWWELERLWGAVGLRPTVVDKGTSREAVPVYKNGQQIGQATSHLYSPLLKQYIALATLKTEYAQLGSPVDLEMTVEYSRHLATATITSLPFFNPARKRT